MFAKKMILAGAICFGALCVGNVYASNVEEKEPVEEVVAVTPAEEVADTSDEVVAEDVQSESADETAEKSVS